MPVNASITGHSGTKTGNFPLMVAFTAPITSVTGFDDADITITAVSGNGITGVTFEVTGSGADYNIVFQLPEDVSGSFMVAISGMVTVEGSSGPEAVMANSPIVTYNNITNIRATLDKTHAEYREGGIVAIPMTFGENVIAPSKTICKFSNPTDPGAGIAGIEGFYLVGADDAYELVVQIGEEKKGKFVVGFEGDVLKAASGVWDNVTNNQSLADRTFAYDTRAPRIVDYDIPADYSLGAPVDVRVAFNVRVTGWHVNNTLTEIFIEEGVLLGSALPYKWTGTSPPDIHAAMPEDLTGTDWTLLATPPAGDPTPNQNGFDADGQWHGEEGQYFLIRFPDPQNTGILNLTLKENAVRGPTSS